MYIYDPAREYYVREQIQFLKERLIWPNTFVDVLILNLYSEFLEYLKSMDFGGEALLNTLLQNEQNDSNKVTTSVRREAVRGDFLNALNTKIKSDIEPSDDIKKSFVFVHVFGEIYQLMESFA